MPRYRIHQLSHIDDVNYDVGAEVELDDRHIPGPHWEPLDDAARAICEKHGHTFTGEVPDVLPALATAYGDAVAAATAAMTPQKMAELMAAAVAAALSAQKAAAAADGMTPEESDKRLAAIVAAAVKAAIPSPEQFVDAIDKVIAARRK